MKNRTPIFAIAVCAMLLLPSAANAFWLDIIKGMASGVIGAVKEQAKLPSGLAAKPAKEPAKPEPEAKPEAQPMPEEAGAALDSLTAACRRISEKVPCAVGRGIGNTPSAAMEAAHDKAIVAMAKSMGAYVKSNAQTIEKALETEDDYKSSEQRISVSNISVEQEVKNTQIYLTYSRKTKKGAKELDEVFLVLVMDKSVFEKALAETAQGSPVSQQTIGESVKSIALFIKNAFWKR